MSLQTVQAGEVFGHDTHLEVAAPIPGAGVAGMKMRLIFNEKFRRLESTLEPFAYCLLPGFRHGSTNLKGLTVTRSNTPAVT